jgi:ABC-2 type transport system permease protein
MNPFMSYWLLLKWQILRNRQSLPVIVVIQLALALGVVYGLALLIPNITKTSALYLATGAPTMALLLLGLTVVPQEAARSKVSGQAAYISSLPVPRLASPAAEVSFWLMAQLPGTFLALYLASVRFNFDLNLSGGLIPAIGLVAVTGASVGYGLAMLLKPELTQQLSSFIAVGLIMFSPINFPFERLPEVLKAIHQVLPVRYMADLMRWGFTGNIAGGIGRAFAIAGAWCLAGLFMSWRVAIKKV